MARLERGELLTRERTVDLQSGSLIGGTAMQVVDAPPEAVWRAVQDTPHYVHLLPEVDEARIVQRGRRNRVVYFRHTRGPLSASYHVQVVFDNASRTARFRVDRSRPHSLRQGHGVLTVQPWGEGRSVILWTILADVGGGAFGGLVRPQIHDSMLRVPETIRRYVEGSGRARYVR
jgi:carbon monoxide dehydrogenase subunit G